jgi:hypothetical protein
VDIEKVPGIEKLKHIPTIYPGKITTLGFPSPLMTIPDTYILVDMLSIENFASYSRGMITINPRGD